MSSINKLLLQLSTPIWVVLLLLPPKLEAQTYDTLRLMTYNLMYYRETTSFCTTNNNNANAKDGYMEDIIDYVLPDILVVNELGGSNASLNSFRLASNALNQNGRNYYSFANATGSGQNLVNMIYFNQNKVVLKNQFEVTKDITNRDLVRSIDVYTLYYKDSNLVHHQDTTFIHVIAAHLKAGSSSPNDSIRSLSTEAVMARLDSMNASGNYFFAGDLNLYTSTEPAYQDLVSYVKPALRFYDPVNASGNWGSSAYTSLHTQSTHTSGGCFAGGGMDDRFDFILASDEVMNNTDKVEYINNSYTTVGQDGAVGRYNGSLISPTNNSAPSTVINALYNMSDHLPVTVDLKITKPSLTSISEEALEAGLSFQNPVADKLRIHLKDGLDVVEELEIYSLSGQLMSSKKHNGSSLIEFDLSGFSKGVYFLYIRSSKGNYRVEKLMKN